MKKLKAGMRCRKTGGSLACGYPTVAGSIYCKDHEAARRRALVRVEVNKRALGLR